VREEKDSMGIISLPDNALYGAQTARALENFKVSGKTAYSEFILATVIIKKAAAVVHKNIGVLSEEKADAIVEAANDLLAGKHADQFVVDVFQAGAGTSHNMNVNEVMANLANERLGGKRGEYNPVHPNDDLNMAQSTNDVIPTAMRLGCLQLLNGLYTALEELVNLLYKKAGEFDQIIKSGRTHLQDATPIRMGQEFSGYAVCIEKHIQHLKTTQLELTCLGIGGSAVGTGLNVHREYRRMMIETLSDMLSIKL